MRTGGWRKRTWPYLKEVEHGHEGGDQVDEVGEQEDRGREVG